jgi:hypothetical protein
MRCVTAKLNIGLQRSGAVSPQPWASVRSVVPVCVWRSSDQLFIANVPVKSQVFWTGVHVTPLPLKPELQVHVKLPAEFAHVAFGLQSSRFSVHSSTSLHVTPLPL